MPMTWMLEGKGAGCGMQGAGKSRYYFPVAGRRFCGISLINERSAVVDGFGVAEVFADIGGEQHGAVGQRVMLHRSCSIGFTNFHRMATFIMLCVLSAQCRRKVVLGQHFVFCRGFTLAHTPIAPTWSLCGN